MEVLVITPPRSAAVRKMISRSYPGYASVDSVPLRAAQILENGGFTVGFLPLYNLIDSFSTKGIDDIATFLNQCEPDVVLEINDYYIRSRSITSYHSSLQVAHLIKKRNPNCQVILAGGHVSHLGRVIFKDSRDVDIVALFEVEDILTNLVEQVEQNKSLHEIKGIIYSENGKIKENEGYGTVKDLNSLPVPAYHLLRPWMEQIPEGTGRVSGMVDLTIRTGYGCPNRCAFCAGAPNWNLCRVRNAEKVAEDIEYAKEALKGKKFSFSYFDDEDMNSNFRHLIEISRMMQEHDMYVEGVLANIPSFTKEVGEEIAKFSTSILTGGENAVDSILATINKKQTFDQVRRACRVAKDCGLSVNLQWIVGLPRENIRTMAVNLHAIFSMLMKGEVRSISPGILRPQPGSDIGEHPERYGITIHHRDWSQYHSKGGYPVYSTETLTREQIFTYYMMAELVAAEASQIRTIYESHNLEPTVWEPEVDLFTAFMRQVGSA